MTVVDGVNFIQQYQQAQSLQEAGQSPGEDDLRSVADLLIEQIEFCDVIPVSKTDLLTPSQQGEVMALLASLNPDARIMPIAPGKLPLEAVLNTGSFSFEKAQQAPGWLKELRGEHVPETENYGISSFVYQARRPFAPDKFYSVINGDWGGGKLLRSKGFSGWRRGRGRPGSGAGRGIAHYGLAGTFWRAIPQDNWPQDPEARAHIQEKWVEPFGDMRQNWCLSASICSRRRSCVCWTTAC